MASKKRTGRKRGANNPRTTGASVSSIGNSDLGEKYSSWYDRNKNNPFIWITDFFFDNFIFLPSQKSPFMGLVRFFVYLGILMYDWGMTTTIWTIILTLFCFAHLGLGLIQFCGLHFGDKDEDGHLSEGPAPRIDYSQMTDQELLKKFPGIDSWFNTRETYLRGMPGSEQAKFFVETGSMTTGSLREMANFPSTRRALERLDYELKRPAKDQVEFMRGRTSKK